MYRSSYPKFDVGSSRPFRFSHTEHQWFSSFPFWSNNIQSSSLSSTYFNHEIPFPRIIAVLRKKSMQASTIDFNCTFISMALVCLRVCANSSICVPSTRFVAAHLCGISHACLNVHMSAFLLFVYSFCQRLVCQWSHFALWKIFVIKLNFVILSV